MSEPNLPSPEQRTGSGGRWLPIVILITGGMALAISSCFGLLFSVQQGSWMATFAIIGFFVGGVAFFAGIVWAIVAFVRRLIRGERR